MIPTVLLAGLILGLAIPSWWSVPIIAAGWAVWIAADAGADAVLGALLFGAVNAAVGVAVGRGLRHLATTVAHRS